jgi:hypothetical protein
MSAPDIGVQAPGFPNPDLVGVYAICRVRLTVSKVATENGQSFFFFARHCTGVCEAGRVNSVSSNTTNIKG